MRIAVAQSSSRKGDIEYNVENHLRYVREAGLCEVDYLVFPELSLTGYEPALAKHLAFKKDDVRLVRLVEAARNYHMSIGVGAPLVSDGLPKIGLIIIHETGKVDTYEKMHLHGGEENYFSRGDRLNVFGLENQSIGNAICADTSNPDHAKLCSEAGASVYIAGVLVTPGGYEEESRSWEGYASKYNMLVAISNYNKRTGGWPSAGKSAIWFMDTLLAQAGAHEDAIVVAENTNGAWSGKIHRL